MKRGLLLLAHDPSKICVVWWIKVLWAFIATCWTVANWCSLETGLPSFI
jgi:hypothetical protein